MRYHMTPDGPKPCRATKRSCKYGEHYSDKKSAETACSQQFEKLNEFKSIQKKKPKKNNEMFLKKIQDAYSDLEIDVNEITDPFDKVMYQKNPQMFVNIYKNRKIAEIFEEAQQTLSEPVGIISISDEELSALDEKENALLEKINLSLSEKQKKTIQAYTGLKYQNINSFLRDENEYLKSIGHLSDQQKQEYFQSIQESIKDLDSIFEMIPENAENRTLYRCIQNDEVEFAEDWANRLGYEEGKTISFSSYSSTSYSPERMGVYCDTFQETAKNIIFKFSTKKGVPVNESKKNRQYVQDVEREILLPRNQQYRIKKISRDYVLMKDDD